MNCSWPGTTQTTLKALWLLGKKSIRSRCMSMRGRRSYSIRVQAITRAAARIIATWTFGAQQGMRSISTAPMTTRVILKVSSRNTTFQATRFSFQRPNQVIPPRTTSSLPLERELSASRPLGLTIGRNRIPNWPRLMN